MIMLKELGDDIINNVIVRSAKHDVTIFGRQSDNTALRAEMLTSPTAPQHDRVNKEAVLAHWKMRSLNKVTRSAP